jgi:nicotinamidase/pyrazinamidase
VRLGFTVTIVEDACRGIGLPTPDGRTTMHAARDKLTDLGVRFASSDAI